MKKKKVTVAKVVNILYYIVMGLLIIGIVSALITRSKEGGMPRFFGYTPTIVMSGSMVPTIEVYSMCLLKNVDIENIEVGDIIVYRDTNKHMNIIHRVYEKDTNEQGEIVLKTWGDNNKFPDTFETTSKYYKGKIVKIMNWTASIILFLMLPDRSGFDMGKVFAITTAFVIIVLAIKFALSKLVSKQNKIIINNNTKSKED